MTSGGLLRRSGTAMLSVATALLLVPASALADTFCVQPLTCNGQDYPTLGEAMQAADANSPALGLDQVLLPAGSFPGAPQAIDESGEPIHVQGAGVGQTIISPPTDPTHNTTLTLGDKDSSVSDVTIEVPVTAFTNTGMYLNGSADRIALTTSAPHDNQTAIQLAASGGPFTPSVRHTSIDLSASPNSTGIVHGLSSTATIEDVSIAANTAILANGAMTVRRASIRATQVGIAINGGGLTPGSLTLEDSTITTAGHPTIALQVLAGNSGSNHEEDSTLVARHVTLVGDGDDGSTGVLSEADAIGPNSSASASLTNSVVRGFGKSVKRMGSTSNAQADMSVSYSDIDLSPAAVTDTGAGALTQGPGNINADPLFRNAASRDYRVMGTSPVIDAGDPAGLGAGESSTDLAGMPRIAGGRTDMGAFEYAGLPIAAIAASPNPVTAGQSATFDASGSAPRETAIADYAWDLDGDGTFETDTGTTPTAARPFPVAGSFPVTARVTAVDGGASTASVTETVLAAAGGPGPGGPAGPTDPVAIGAFTLSNRVFAVGSDPTAVSARKRKPKRGTTFRYVLDRPADVTITIARNKGKGRRKGKRCVKRTHRNRKKPACTRYKRAGALKRAGQAGQNDVPFSGRIGSKALRPGRYRATIVAVDAAGRSKPSRLTFRIVKP